MPHSHRSPDIPQLLAILEDRSVRYVLTGSVAAQVYGVEIGTPADLDVTPALERDNLERLAAALGDMEAALDLEGPEGHWEVQTDGERTWAVDEVTPEVIARRAAWFPNPQNVTTMDHLYLTRYGNFDVVPEVSGTYETLIDRAVQRRLYGHLIWVANVDDLLAALTVPRRKKDGPRVQQLRTLQRKLGGRWRYV